MGVPPSAPVYPALAVQAVAAALPATLLLLSGQSVQDVAVSVAVLYVPAPQFSHVMPLLFRPAPHSFAQVPPLGPLQPLMQVQAVAAVEPVKPPVPELAGQAAQAAEPKASLKVSAAHAEGVTPFGPVYPASAMQSSSASDAAGLPELSGQELQVSVVCAASLLYLPVSQLVHAAAEEAVVLNVPAAQAVTLDPDPVCPASARQLPSDAVP